MAARPSVRSAIDLLRRPLISGRGLGPLSLCSITSISPTCLLLLRLMGSIGRCDNLSVDQPPSGRAHSVAPVMDVSILAKSKVFMDPARVGPLGMLASLVMSSASPEPIDAAACVVTSLIRF